MNEANWRIGSSILGKMLIASMGIVDPAELWRCRMGPFTSSAVVYDPLRTAVNIPSSASFVPPLLLEDRLSAACCAAIDEVIVVKALSPVETALVI